LVHVLDRVCVPPPQDRVQGLNSLHSDQFASTVSINTKKLNAWERR